MAQLYPYTFFALVATMVIFLATKGRASTIMLYIAVVVQGVVVTAAYAFTLSVSGFSVIGAVLIYLIPSVIMLYFVLCAVLFNDIIGGLKGKLKFLMATSLVSYGLITCAMFFERQITNWFERTFTFRGFGWAFGILYWLIAALWILGTLVAHGGMFIYALKTPQKRAKKILAIIAFLFPIIGSVIYLVHFYSQ